MFCIKGAFWKAPVWVLSLKLKEPCCFSLTPGLTLVVSVTDREFIEKSSEKSVMVEAWYKAWNHFYNLQGFSFCYVKTETKKVNRFYFNSRNFEKKFSSLFSVLLENLFQFLRRVYMEAHSKQISHIVRRWSALEKKKKMMSTSKLLRYDKEPLARI